METHSAKLLSTVYQGDLQTQVGGMKCSCITAGTCTDHNHIRLSCLSVRAVVLWCCRAVVLHAKNLPNSSVLFRIHIDRLSIPPGHFSDLTHVV